MWQNKAMSIGKEFLQELLLESRVTRKYLELVPFEKKDFRPAEKSESLGRLAIHVAEIFEWWLSCVNDSQLDFEQFEPADINSAEELTKYFDELMAKVSDSLKTVRNEEWGKIWTMAQGEHILCQMPKKQVARVFCLNHLVHHRAQLGVYLRLLGIALPATYGPSADDDEVLLVDAM